MLSPFAKPLLTSTAIAPVLLVYAWVAYQAGDFKMLFIFLLLCATLVAICIWILKDAEKHLERMRFAVTTIEAADRENISFLLLYLLPLFTEDFSTFNWNIWIPVIVIFAFVVATGYNYHFNPLLGLFGWHFYKVGTKEGVTYVLITKKQLRNVTETIEVGQLTEYIVMDVGGR